MRVLNRKPLLTGDHEAEEKCPVDQDTKSAREVALEEQNASLRRIVQEKEDAMSALEQRMAELEAAGNSFNFVAFYVLINLLIWETTMIKMCHVEVKIHPCTYRSQLETSWGECRLSEESIFFQAEYAVKYILQVSRTVWRSTQYKNDSVRLLLDLSGMLNKQPRKNGRVFCKGCVSIIHWPSLFINESITQGNEV